MYGKMGTMRSLGIPVASITAAQMNSLVTLVHRGMVSGAAGKEVLQAMLSGDGRMAGEIVADRGLEVVDDSALLAAAVDVVLEKNPEQSRKLASGQAKLVKWFVGQVMRDCRGKFRAAEIEYALLAKCNDFHSVAHAGDCASDHQRNPRTYAIDQADATGSKQKHRSDIKEPIT